MFAGRMTGGFLSLLGSSGYVLWGNVLSALGWIRIGTAQSFNSILSGVLMVRRMQNLASGPRKSSDTASNTKFSSRRGPWRRSHVPVQWNLTSSDHIWHCMLGRHRCGPLGGTSVPCSTRSCRSWQRRLVVFMRGLCVCDAVFCRVVFFFFEAVKCAQISSDMCSLQM